MKRRSQGGGTQITKKLKVKESKRINDPVWLTIELNPLCARIIDTPEFQRLRSIKQMGGCNFVYPGAVHTRFEHSIGTSYLAGEFGRELQKNSPEVEITEKDILCLEVAGLCHDLGHGPFSHVFDQQFISKAKKNKCTWKHEDASLKMVDRIFERIDYHAYLEKNDIEFIKDLIKGKDISEAHTVKGRKKYFLFEIVANKFNSIDVDKWDYFSRDCHMLGLHHNFQCERSIKSARVFKQEDTVWHISFPKSDYHHIFDLFYTRFTIHRRACFHPVVKAVEMMIADALCEADKFLMFPPNKNENQKCLSDSMMDMDAYLCVTDDVLHQIKALDSDKSAKIRKAKDIVERIERHDFFKLIKEKKVIMGNANRSWGDLKKSMERELKNNGIDFQNEDLFDIEPVEFNYGNKDKNPMTNVKLYQKVKRKNMKVKYINAVMTQEETSDMLPSKFKQLYIRLYWKGKDIKADESKRERLIKEFSRIKVLPLVNAKGKSLKSQMRLVDVQ